MDENKVEQAREILKLHDGDDTFYAKVRDLLYDGMNAGLDLSTRAEASIKMYPTYVTKLPSGGVSGKYLSLDLGGTNYRVLLVTLNPDTAPVIIERTYAIPKEKMFGKGEELFDYIATTLYNFLASYTQINEKLLLGFTFSFPCVQRSLGSATLAHWTKGFAASGVVGEDVGKLLQQAIDKTKAQVEVVAVVNDTVGTLASCALHDSNCYAGVIIGTGTNACYIEKIENIPLIEKYAEQMNLKGTDHMVINMEWGAFGSHGEIDALRTPYDIQLDAESLHPGTQIFEKMCSGMYLGELVRLICVDMCKKGLLFRGEIPGRFRIKDAFSTKYITETERDPPHLFYSTNYLLNEDLQVPTSDTTDHKIVRMVCEAVAKRAAYLIGAGIAALLLKMQVSKCTIAIDGSLYKFHPKFRERMTDIVDKLKPKNTERFRLTLSEDGSGKGAAAIASTLDL